MTLWERITQAWFILNTMEDSVRFIMIHCIA